MIFQKGCESIFEIFTNKIWIDLFIYDICIERVVYLGCEERYLLNECLVGNISNLLQCLYFKQSIQFENRLELLTFKAPADMLVSDWQA